MIWSVYCSTYDLHVNATTNTTKTEFMLIGSRQGLSTLSDTLELSIDDVPIEQVSIVKFLGT